MKYKLHQQAMREEIMQREPFGPKGAFDIVVWQEENPKYLKNKEWLRPEVPVANDQNTLKGFWEYRRDKMVEYSMSVYYCKSCQRLHQCQGEATYAMRFCPGCGQLMGRVGNIPVNHDENLIAGGYF